MDSILISCPFIVQGLALPQGSVRRKLQIRGRTPSKLVSFFPTHGTLLVDGTYELFRHYYAVPSARDKQGREVGAVRAVLASVLGMIKGGATHISVATMHDFEPSEPVVAGVQDREGVEPELLRSSRCLRTFCRGRGLRFRQWWVRNRRRSAAGAAAAERCRVERVIICTPDKTRRDTCEARGWCN